MRRPISPLIEDAKEQAKVAAVKKISPPKSTGRRPKRSLSGP
jgi:hypothetical protein